MTLLKIPFKIIALPIALAMTVAQWFGIFLTSFAGAIFYIFSGLCFLIAILGYLMGICTGTESVRTLMIGLVAFVLPFVAGWAIVLIAALKESFWGFIKFRQENRLKTSKSHSPIGKNSKSSFFMASDVQLSV